MRRFGNWTWIAIGVGLAIMLGAAPAAPSYYEVERTIASVRGAWAKPGAAAQPNAPGWNALFDALQKELGGYTAAGSENERLASLNRVYQFSVALASTSWQPALDVREALRAWLRPRVRLAWAERRLVDHVRKLGEPNDPGVKTNRDRWVQFVGQDLGHALKDYDGSATVAQRVDALKRLNAALGALQAQNSTRPWVPSNDLLAALNDLYNVPNLDVSADRATVEPALNQNLVQNGPVYHKGYWSQVTAGAKTGFGLLPSDEGIAFYNSQYATSVTPVHDFNSQMQQDRRGKRATKLYYFTATTVDQSHITVTAVLTPNGLRLSPEYQHNVDAMISSVKQSGGAVGRFIASLVGFNQSKITNKVYEGAIGQMREKVVVEAAEVGAEKMGQAQAEQNAKLAQYLLFGRDAATFRNLIIYRLSLRSRPENVLLGGTLNWSGSSAELGADAPQPSHFTTPDTGVSADLHLSSILTSMLRGYLQTQKVQAVENVMVVSRKTAPGTPPKDAFTMKENVGYADFLAAVKEARLANDPKVMAIRAKRPETPPDFGADALGNLVAIVHELQVDVPAPPQAAAGGFSGPPAQVYRISAPSAEFAINFQITPETERSPVRLSGKIASFDPGPGARILAINEDETKAAPLNAFASNLILGVIRGKVVGQPIDVPLSNMKLRGFAIREVSPLEPSGWIRVNLVRTSESPAAGIQ